MYFLEIDQAANRMHITLLGAVDKKQAKGLMRQIEKRCNELHRGFILLTDLSRLETLSAEATRYIRRSMDIINDHGVSLVVRVISHPSRNFFFSIMSLFHYDRFIPIIICDSLEEATKHMINATKEDRIDTPIEHAELAT
jgi:hypothetical protein